MIYIHGLNDYPLMEKNTLSETILYIYGPAGLISTEKNGAVQYVIKDHLGSTRVVVNDNGTVAGSYNYLPLGGVSEVSGNGDITYLYTGQERDDELGLNNFRARMYDSELGKFYAMDPMGQFASPYVFCGNNSIGYVDKDGRIIPLIPIIIGAAMGAYAGHEIAEAKGAEGWQMAGYMVGGAIIGGVSGYAGATIAASGGAFSHTGAIMTSSYMNSVGMNALSGGMTDVSISFGVGSYNFTQGKFGYLGQAGNSTLENVGYGLGALANISDGVEFYDSFQQEYRQLHPESNLSTEQLQAASDKSHNSWFNTPTQKDANYAGLSPAGVSPKEILERLNKGLLTLDGTKDGSTFGGYCHDLAYFKAGTDGFRGAFFNTRVLSADLQIIRGMTQILNGSGNSASVISGANYIRGSFMFLAGIKYGINSSYLYPSYRRY